MNQAMSADEAAASSSSSSCKAAVNDGNIPTSESKQTNVDLITNWYQSYYAWNSAFMAHSVINANMMMMNGGLAMPISQTLRNRFFANSCLLPHCQHCRVSTDSNSRTFYAAAGPHARPASFQHTRSSQQQANPPMTQPLPTHATAASGIQSAAPSAHLVNYRIPSLFKRLMAESFDAVYIQCIKITIALLLLSYTDFFDEESFKLFDLIETLLNEDNINGVRLPMELLLLEVIYVLISVLFEGFCLYKKGFTPGKYLFGLKVIACSRVNEGASNMVQVAPGTTLSLKSIIIRTFLKNFSIVFLFPTILFFLLPAFAEHGQTSYDKAAESIVVEKVPTVN